MKTPIRLITTLVVCFTSFCSAVVITPQSGRPWLVSGPADKVDIKTRLAVFACPTSASLHACRYGIEAEKQAASAAYLAALPNPFYSARRTAENSTP